LHYTELEETEQLQDI